MIKTTAFILFISLIMIGCEKNKSVPPSGKAAEFSIAAEEVIDTVQISYFLGPPFLFHDTKTKKMSGATYDLIEQYISPEIGVKFEWDSTATTIPRQLLGLKNKKKYVAALLTYVPGREEFCIFSKKPYFSGRPIIAVHKNNPLTKVRNINDIKHLVFGYAQKAYISSFMKHPEIQFELVGNPDFQEINLKKTLNKRIDAVYSLGRGSTLFFMKKLNVVDQFRLIDLPEKPTPYYVVFTKDLDTVARKFDAAFEKLGGPELYLRLLSKYIEVSKL
jgi:polar amino acid transport system substrate-binding protein